MRTNGARAAADTDGPPYEADWIPDASQDMETLIDRHQRNAANPAAHEVYRRQLEEKTKRFGVIHIDPATGYRSRFQPQTGREGAHERRTDTAGATADRGVGTRLVDEGIRDRTGQAPTLTPEEKQRRVADLERQLAAAKGEGGEQG